MERLKKMKEKLIDCVEEQINNCLEQASAEELGEAVDMIKDLDEAIYYGTLTKAMEEQEHQNYNTYYYTEKVRPIEYPYERYELPYGGGETMYYGGNGSGGSRGGSVGRLGSANSARGTSGSNGMNYFHQGYGYQPVNLLPEYSGYEGKSGSRRRMYMEGKQNRQDKTQQMKELEAYVQDLGQDLTEMIQDASPEEKQLLQQKISLLASKIK